MKKIGYARVSTEDQKLDLQRDALRQAGCARIYHEKRSGASDRRPALDRALMALGSGDMLVVWKLDRLGRSLQHLLTILDELKIRGIGFCSLSDGIDTTTPAGKLLFHITGAVAEFERSLIAERTKAGMATARRKGRQPGRPRRLDDTQACRVRNMAIVEELPLTVIAERMQVSKSTVQRVVKAFRAEVASRTAAACAVTAERQLRVDAVRAAIDVRQRDIDAVRKAEQRPAPSPAQGVGPEGS